MDKQMNKEDVVLIIGYSSVWIDLKDNPEALWLKTLMSTYKLSKEVTEQTQRSGHILNSFVNEFQLDILQKVTHGRSFSNCYGHTHAGQERPKENSVIL